MKSATPWQDASRVRLSPLRWTAGRALAACALGAATLHFALAAPPNVDDGRPALAEATAPTQDDRAVKEFLDAYSLAPGEVLKRIPPPRPGGVRVWAERNRRGAGDDLEHVSSMTFRWVDPDRLEQHWSRFGGAEGWSIRELPTFLGCHVSRTEIEGDAQLLNSQISGDWVYRKGASDEQIVRRLEAIVQRALKQRVRLEFRNLERDVIVAAGAYRSMPVRGGQQDRIEIYAKEIIRDGTGGGGSGTLAEFLRWVGDWIEWPVVNEVTAPPAGNIAWHTNSRKPVDEQTRREDHDEALVLPHLREQTGLTFTRARRKIRILLVERAR
jgi:hypothetical protein